MIEAEPVILFSGVREDRIMTLVLELPEIIRLYPPQPERGHHELATEPPCQDEDLYLEGWAFLDRHLFLVPVLKEAFGPLRDIFGEKGKASLSVTTDPEVEDWEYLVVAIHTTLPADQAQAQLDAFGEAWWLENLPRAKGKLLFTLEFV